ncbi:hypothetical protein DVH24_016312 [Malus domestica]|uniref:Methyltransferase type 11 domain-containing protein n=1 Tax=Malus domestica TaxID=3750 RepID=A0A498HRW3_MALDO|nr:hypothetical protein DVH24_016312 [Malus domestica]
MALSGLLLPISSIIIFIFLAYKLYQRLRFKLPPGPRPWPVVGNLYQITPVRFRCYNEWAQKYGPIISVWIGSTLSVVVNNTELAKEVLKENDQKLADRHRNRSTAKLSRDGQDLIWADYGPHYVKVRKVCTLELFSAKRLEDLRPIREDEVTAMVESVFNHCTKPENNGKSLTVRKYLGTVAFNNITRLAFGKRFINSDEITDEQGKEFRALIADGVKKSGSLSVAEHISWLRWACPFDEEAFARHEANRDKLTKEIMDEHTQARSRGGVAKSHFVDALFTLKDKYDLSMDTIIGLLWDMMAAGTDTTAITAEWGMAELIKNPRVQQKAQEELDKVIGVDRVLTENDFSNLPYLQCVAKEALRLHPPAPLMLPHRANADVKIGGYDVPKGSIVHVNIWAIARDPAVWKSPNAFRPERFLEEDFDIKGHDFRLLPFGSGRRVCPGAQLGINLVASMLGHLLHHFSWAPPQGVNPEEIDMSENPGTVTYMATPVEVVPTPRLPSHLYKRVEATIKMAGLFDKQAEDYLVARPTYPKEWYSMLAALTPKHSLAWDVGTGNGQAAFSLGEHYEQVIGSDISESQLKSALQHPRVRYVHTPVTMSDDELVDLIGGENSVDLVTVAEAVHWFDLPKFYSLVKSIFKPFWDPKREYLWEGYRTLPFPFESVGLGSEGQPVALEILKEVSFEGVLRMLRSSSAVNTAKDQGVDLLSQEVIEEIQRAWGRPNVVRNVTFKAFTLAGKV